MNNFSIAAGVIFALITTNCWALNQHRESDELVLLIETKYDRGRWGAKPIAILPCGAPSSPMSRSDMSSMLQLFDRKGSLLFQQYTRNPRWVHFEGTKEGKKPDIFLDSVKVTFAVPIRQHGKYDVPLRDIGRFAFFETVGETKRPSVSLPLGREIQKLANKMDSQTSHACQVSIPSTDHLPSIVATLGQKKYLGSHDLIKKLLMENPDLAIQFIADSGVSPATLRKSIYQHRESWKDFGFDEAKVFRLLKKYNQIYRKKR